MSQNPLILQYEVALKERGEASKRLRELEAGILSARADLADARAKVSRTRADAKAACVKLPKKDKSDDES